VLKVRRFSSLVKLYSFVTSQAHAPPPLFPPLLPRSLPSCHSPGLPSSFSLLTPMTLQLFSPYSPLTPPPTKRPSRSRFLLHLPLTLTQSRPLQSDSPSQDLSHLALNTLCILCSRVRVPRVGVVELRVVEGVFVVLTARENERMKRKGTSTR
jgi:hypothetical protein